MTPPFRTKKLRRAADQVSDLAFPDGTYPEKFMKTLKWCSPGKRRACGARETLAPKKQGACRDLTVLFMACCRSVGLASRFVSGYGPGEKNEHPYLHAWPEVYLPGGGWRGYDPTQGLAVGDGYVALAAGPHPELAAPDIRSYSGEPALNPIWTMI